MPERRSLYLLVLCALLAPRLAAADAPLLARARAAIRAAAPFSVDFRQQVSIDGVPEAAETGVILFATPTRLKWTYRQPDHKVFLLEGDRYQFLNSPERQLLRGRIAKESDRLLWQLLDETRPAAGVSVREERGRIVIESREGEESRRLEIELDAGHLPSLVVQEDGSGVRNETRFFHYRPRLTLRPGDLTLDIPPGTEIVDE